MIVSKKALSKIDLQQFNPGQIIDQLKFSPEIFPFLKERENIMGPIRPIITYCVGVAIWAFKKSSLKKRDIPFGFLESLWIRIHSNKDLPKRLGDAIETLEPELWDFLLSIIKTETIRNKEITEKELGAGCLILLVVIIGLIFAFGSEQDLIEIDKILGSGE